MRRSTALEGLAALTLLVLAPAVRAETQPAARDVLIREALAAREAQDFQHAIALLEKARADHPGDPEVLRLLGTSYAFAGRHADAVATLSQARDLAPDDLDVRAALARALFWAGRRPEAETELAAIEARDPGNAEAAELRRQMTHAPGPSAPPTSSPRRSGVALWSTFSDVSFEARGSRTWWTAGASAHAAVTPRTTLSAEVERDARGRVVDTHFLARIDQGFSSAIRGHLGFTGTPNADFREDWSIRGGLEGDIGAGITLLVDARRSDYGDIETTAVEPGARLAIRPISGSLTLRMINLWDEADTHRSGWSARLDGGLKDGTLLFGGGATYPDTEAGITRRVHAAFAGAQFPVGERWAVRVTGDYEERARSYTRKGVTLGLQMRF